MNFVHLAHFFAFNASQSAATVQPRKKGGIGHSKKRRIMVDGKVYTVRHAREEAEILEAYIEQQEQQLRTAEEMHKPVIRAMIRRAKKRAEKVDRKAEWMRKLQEEDEEIILLVAATLH